MTVSLSKTASMPDGRLQNDGYVAEIVLKVTFVMDDVTKVAKNGAVSFTGGMADPVDADRSAARRAVQGRRGRLHLH